MTLSEWFEQNKNKEITYNGGKIEIKTTCPFYHGETYYYVTFTGTVYADHWVYSEWDQTLYEMGNCFRTEKEAEEAAAVIREAFAKIREENK